MTEPVGALALEALGDGSGAVIADLYGRSLYWLVTPGSAADWRLPHVSMLGAKAHEVTYVGVPPAGCVRGPGVHWRVPYARDRYLTDPDRLHRALLSALTRTQVCRRCDTPTTEPVPVHVTHGASGPGHTLYACPPCAPLYSVRHQAVRSR
ncbi:hypothetical protein ACQUSR_19700 [Streptomyces sp. P1-3]|uniref:hypothetical protein n=1 Tax=Streptomyces sp. P1-3 TaxID=3421658 RepID=UPI003D35F62E